MMRVKDVRVILSRKYMSGDIAENGTVEMLNASFIADEDSIFGKVNWEYVDRELEWYMSQSLNIKDIPEGPPKIWQQISGQDGEINSNYGWCVFSTQNKNQYSESIQALKNDKYTRQAVMIYNRPSMHVDASFNGMKDFMCTFSAQMFIRKNTLTYHVYMRSNDALFGYKNDLQWHKFVFNKAYSDLLPHYPALSRGDIHWNAASLHVYPRHFHLIKDN